MEEKRVHSEDFRYLALGAVAAFLYGTTVFAPFFVAPLQTSWTRGGFRAFLMSLAVAFIGITGWMFWQLKGIPQIGITGVTLLLAFPVGFAAAVAIMNSRFLSTWPFVYRAMVGGMVISAIAVPSVASMFGDPEIEEYLREGIREMTKNMASASGEGFTAAVLKSSLDPDTILDSTRKVITNSFAAFFFIFTFIGHWMGTRMAGRDAPGSGSVPRIHEYSVPANMIWGFLGLWAAVLATRLPFVQSLRSVEIFESIAWNASLAVSFCYAVQGLAVLRHLLGRIAPAGPLRWGGILLVVLLLFNVSTGAWTAGILTVFGATETWIPYRISKGVQT